ncbi:MAG: hypothetical protein KDK36_03190 [Leptospiraceae bacterium]|nr:hypothetical protein [Leptospiraceae bacterium]
MTEELIKPFEVTEKHIVILIPDRVDIQITREYIKKLESTISSSHRSIIIKTENDFQLSSIYFGFIMTVHNFTKTNNLDLSMVCNKEKILKMFDMLKIGHLFTVYPTMEDALK